MYSNKYIYFYLAWELALLYVKKLSIFKDSKWTSLGGRTKVKQESWRKTSDYLWCPDNEFYDMHWTAWKIPRKHPIAKSRGYKWHGLGSQRRIFRVRLGRFTEDLGEHTASSFLHSYKWIWRWMWF